MPAFVPWTLAAGATSAGLYAMLLTGPLGLSAPLGFGALIIPYFAQIPLFAIGLWLGVGGAALAAALAVAVLLALGGIVFALVFGAYRMMRRRVTWSAVLFTLALLVILVGALPLAQVGWLTQFRSWLLAVPVSAGARGILLGIALATVVTAVRVLIGQDRSYRE